MNRGTVLRTCAAVWAASLLGGVAHADLIFDRAATKVINGGDDVNPVNVTLPTAFTLFGVSQPVIRVGSNGAFGVPGGLNGTQYDGSQSPWHNTGAGKPIIATLWDDLNTSPNGAPLTGLYAGLSSIGNTSYANAYSFTAPAAYSYGPGNNFTTKCSYQLSLFTGAETVTLGGGETFSFLAGDIAFSYGTNLLGGFDGGAAAVGVTDGEGTVVGMPGTTNGVLSGANVGLLPSGKSFVLFRASGNSYVSSIETFSSATPPQWNNAAGGTYNEPTSWVGGVPNGIGAVANFLAVGATNPITVDTAVVVGTINFNNAAAYTINGPQGITLQSATTAAVNVIAGSHAINAPITLASAAGVDVATGLTLTTNTLVGPFAVTKTGTGVLAANKIDIGSLDIAGGTVRLIDSGTGIEGDVNGLGTNGGNGGTVGAGSTSVVTGLTLAGPTTAPTSTLDIRNNDLVVRAAAVNIDSVRDQVAFAYNSGLWDRPGITSSRAAADGLAVGFGSNLDLGYAVFSGVATGTDDFVVKYTWFGDANLDGQVDGDDYLLWLAVFGSSGSGIGWGQGDFDYDQEVDGDDYLLWLQNFGNGIGSPLAVPEPGVMGLAAVAGAGMLARRRRGVK